MTGEKAAIFREYVAAKYEAGLTIEAIVALTERSYGAVRDALVTAGVELRPRGRRVSSPGDHCADQ
ncbi:hypothetical protein E2651_02675 [Streptomyces sp. MZ04]|nr:hypothetical protein E2651_02675 [Streptomyces sp. MZ04]